MLSEWKRAARKGKRKATSTLNQAAARVSQRTCFTSSRRLSMSFATHSQTSCCACGRSLACRSPAVSDRSSESVAEAGSGVSRRAGDAVSLALTVARPTPWTAAAKVDTPRSSTISSTVVHTRKQHPPSHTMSGLKMSRYLRRPRGWSCEDGREHRRSGARHHTQSAPLVHCLDIFVHQQ